MYTTERVIAIYASEIVQDLGTFPYEF
jgi:hypothetical protein